MSLPDLLAPPRLPRDPIVLCHGLYGYDVRAILGVEMHYWAGIMDVLRERLGVEVIMKGVPPMGSIQERAEALHAYLCSPQAGIRGRKVHFVGHSMGGLDARYLITRIRPTPDQYTPLTLTTISTPHRGSPFMDWCNANIGIGRDLVESEIATARRQGIIPPAHTRSRHRHPDHDPDSAVPPPSEDPVPSLPYSLKAPLFVRRPSSEPSEKKPSATQPDPKRQTSRPSSAPVPAPAPTPSHPTANKAEDSKDKDKDKDKDKTSSESRRPESRGDPSLFTRALDSVGGGFSNWMLSLLDQPAYAMLSTRYMTVLFNPTVPNVRGVSYFSVAARIDKLPMWHPLWLPKLVLDASTASGAAASVRDGSAQADQSERGNDGIVAVHSAIWGHFLGVVEQADHWDLRGGGAPRFRAPRRDPITGRPIGAPTKHKQPPPPPKEAKDQEDQGWMGINRILRALRRSSTSTPNKAKPKPSAGPATQSAFFSPSTPPPPAPTSNPKSSSPSPSSSSSPSTSPIDSTRAPPASAPEQASKAQAPAAAQVANWISARLPDTHAPMSGRSQSAFVPLLPAPAEEEAAADTADQASAADQMSAAVHTVLSSAPSWGTGSPAVPPAVATAENPPFPPVDVGNGHPDVPLASLSEEERLERFWAAICRHLWERGY